MTLSENDILRTPASTPTGTDVLGATNRSVDADQWSFVVLVLTADPSGVSSARITVNADLDGDGSESLVGEAFAAGGLGTNRLESLAFWLPPGATYSVTNNSDPDNGNVATAFETVH